MTIKYKNFPYVNIRFPKTAYDQLNEKKAKVEKQYQYLTGKPRKIWRTDLLNAILSKTIYFDNEEIRRLGGKKK